MVWNSYCSSDSSCLQPPDKQIGDLCWESGSKSLLNQWESFPRCIIFQVTKCGYLVVRRPDCSLGCVCVSQPRGPRPCPPCYRTLFVLPCLCRNIHQSCSPVAPLKGLLGTEEKGMCCTSDASVPHPLLRVSTSICYVPALVLHWCTEGKGWNLDVLLWLLSQQDLFFGLFYFKWQRHVEDM